MYKKDITLNQLKKSFNSLIEDNIFRKELFTKMKKINFIKTKRKTISKIKEILAKNI